MVPAASGAVDWVCLSGLGMVMAHRRLRLSLKLVVFALVIYLVGGIVISGARKAIREIRHVDPLLLAFGLVLEMAALFSYSLLTRAALEKASAEVSKWRMFRIQMSSKSLSSIVPGGSAAGSALAYRLMTLSGVPGPDAGFALASAGLGSAVVLNLIFWLALIVSIPIRGVNPAYASGAIAGVVAMAFAAMLVFGLLEGSGRAERFVRAIARRIHLDQDRASDALRQIGRRLTALAADRALLARVVGWASANWLLDAAALWVLLRAFGASVDVDALLVSFGLVNVLAVVPLTPGGVGVIEVAMTTTLVGFGLARSTATLGVAMWRLAQYFFPILLGAILYASLRVGPWSIKRRAELIRLRELADETKFDHENPLDFAERVADKRTRDV